MKRIKQLAIVLLSLLSLISQAQNHQNISVKIEKEDGVPRIFVDGQKISSVMACLDDPGFLANWKIDQYSHTIDNYFLPLNTPFMFGWHGGNVYTYIDLKYLLYWLKDYSK